MRRLATVGALLVAISSFLAMQAICRPFLACVVRVCEIDGADAMAACTSDARDVASCPMASGCRDKKPCDSPCGGDEPIAEESGCAGMPGGNVGMMPCIAGGLASDMTCCLDGKPTEVPARCPKRVLSCFYCIPARFVWEPPPLHATRDADNANALAVVATTALTSADLVRQSIHAHSPPGIRPALAGSDRRISLCSFLL